MKLSRNTLRSLAVGFLASAVVTAALPCHKDNYLSKVSMGPTF